jgi:hypothetical protein
MLNNKLMDENKQLNDKLQNENKQLKSELKREQEHVIYLNKHYTHLSSKEITQNEKLCIQYKKKLDNIIKIIGEP